MSKKFSELTENEKEQILNELKNAINYSMKLFDKEFEKLYITNGSFIDKSIQAARILGLSDNEFYDSTPKEFYEILRLKRRKQTAEDFTPSSLVNEMLDKLPPEVFIDPSKTFCDNSAGNGNFLIEVLRRKLSNSHPPLQALSTIYGVELMADNVEEMKERLLELIPKDLHKKAKKILDHNIVCHNALTFDFINWKSTEEKIKSTPLF